MRNKADQYIRLLAKRIRTVQYACFRAGKDGFSDFDDSPTVAKAVSELQEAIGNYRNLAAEDERTRILVGIQKLEKGGYREGRR